MTNSIGVKTNIMVLTIVVNIASPQLSWGMPSDKVCEKLKKTDKQVRMLNDMA